MRSSRPVYIVAGQRTPFVKSMTSYMGVTTNNLMLAALKPLVQRMNLEGKMVGDVAFGAVMNSSSNFNLSREVVLSAGLHPWTPAYNVQRACGTGLETAWQLALKISAGQIEDGIAGGVDTNSDLPIEVSLEMRDWFLAMNNAKSLGQRLALVAQLRPNFLRPRTPAVVEPRTGLSMGEHCEQMVKQWQISRAAQDELALFSHQTGVKAYSDGFYKDLVAPFQSVEKDGTLRGDTTLEKLGKLRPAFDRSAAGTLTAGNSSPLTDGAACVLLASEASLKTNGWTPMARFVDAQASALNFVGGEGLLMAPTVAVAKMLKRNGMKLQDFDYYEIHEAFAGQVLCTLKAWESAEFSKKFLGQDQALGVIDRSKMNIKGGSVALGHPFAATGARILGSLSKMISQRKGRGLISICTAGGMGVAAIVEGA